jgi:hypothetical protein
VRVFALGVAVCVAGASVAACGLVSGLDGYSTGEAPDGSLPARNDGSIGARPDGSGSAADVASDDGSTVEMTDGGPGVDGEIIGDASEDTIEDAIEESEQPDTGEVVGADAGEAGTTPVPDGGSHTPEAGCGTPDTVENCGACGVACNTNHSADAGCNGTSCTYACSPGYADCAPEAPNTNGCETATTTTAHCAVCAACNTTTGTPACNGTTCSYTCDNGHYDCNATTPPDTDGCETPASSSSCGKCGQACGTSNGSTFSADSCGPLSASPSTYSCSYTCDNLRQDCNVATAPDQDGCECAGTACCGTGCQTAHSNGISSGASETYYDCSPTVTHSATEAQLACEAYTGGGASSCTTSSTCCVFLGCFLGGTTTAYCGTYNSTSYCWVYTGSSGPAAGTVQSGSSVSCSGSAGSW